MYEKFLSRHVQTIKPNGIRKHFDLASEMEGVISLGIGKPDFGISWHIYEIAIYSIESGKTHCTTNQGLSELREEICLYQERRFQLDYDPMDDVIVAVGGGEAIDIAMRAIVDSGDEVILMGSGHVAYTPSVELTDAVPVHVRLEHEDQFKLTSEEPKATATPKAKAILTSLPSNPTGGAMTREGCTKLVSILKEHEITVISDEIYAELTYGDTFYLPANFNEIKDQVTTISRSSKAYAMTGQRPSCTLVNKTFMDTMSEIHRYTIMFVPTATQYGVIDAVRNGDIHAIGIRESYMTRRNFITRSLNRIGLPTYLPYDAFCIFPDIRGTDLISDELCVQLFEDQCIARVPGTTFDDTDEDPIRIFYVYSIDHIREAIERTDHFMEKSRQK